MEEQEIYTAVGPDGFARLVSAFYRRVAIDDVLGPLYPADDLKGAEERLRGFLVYRFGGPATYIEERGHPRLRMRHARFPIGEEARDRWVKLMGEALEESRFPAAADETLQRFFASTAAFLVNKPG